MQVDVHMITFGGVVFVGSILLPVDSKRLLKRPVQGLKGADVILTDMVNAAIPIKGKLIRSRDNPKLFLRNLPNIYKSGYVYALMSTEKPNVKKDLVELPEDIVAQLPIIPDGVQEIEVTEEMERLLFGDEFEIGNEDD